MEHWIIEQLNLLPSKNVLSEISFELSDPLDEHIWKVVDTILMGEKFKSLQKIGVQPQYMVQYLPFNRNRGIVEVAKPYSYLTTAFQ